MKSLLRNTVFNSISLFVLSQILAGVDISGGFQTILLGGFLLSILFAILKPILNLFSLPLNIVTLGFFSFFSNAILLYILTVLLPNVSIHQFTFNGLTFAGFVVPVMHYSTLWAYVVCAGILSIIMNFFSWLTKK